MVSREPACSPYTNRRRHDAAYYACAVEFDEFIDLPKVSNRVHVSLWVLVLTMNDDDIHRAIRIAHHIGKAPADELASGMNAREVWALIRTEREAAASWSGPCEQLSVLIGDRVRELENILTGKLEEPAPVTVGPA